MLVTFYLYQVVIIGNQIGADFRQQIVNICVDVIFILC